MSKLKSIIWKKLSKDSLVDIGGYLEGDDKSNMFVFGIDVFKKKVVLKVLLKGEDFWRKAKSEKQAKKLAEKILKKHVKDLEKRLNKFYKKNYEKKERNKERA